MRTLAPASAIAHKPRHNSAQPENQAQREQPADQTPIRPSGTHSLADFQPATKPTGLPPLLKSAAMSLGHGKPLMPEVRSDMERAFGHDFSTVRIHEGTQAQSIGMTAYAQGEDLHFAPGEYRPTSPEGRKLIGHELTHVVQQRTGRAALPHGSTLPINSDTALEAEADALGTKAARGESASQHGTSHAYPAAAPAAGLSPIQGVKNKKGAGGGQVIVDPDAKPREDPAYKIYKQGQWYNPGELPQPATKKVAGPALTDEEKVKRRQLMLKRFQKAAPQPVVPPQLAPQPLAEDEHFPVIQLPDLNSATQAAPEPDPNPGGGSQTAQSIKEPQLPILQLPGLLSGTRAAPEPDPDPGGSQTVQEYEDDNTPDNTPPRAQLAQIMADAAERRRNFQIAKAKLALNPPNPQQGFQQAQVWNQQQQNFINAKKALALNPPNPQKGFQQAQIWNQQQQDFINAKKALALNPPNPQKGLQQAQVWNQQQQNFINAKKALALNPPNPQQGFQQAQVWNQQQQNFINAKKALALNPPNPLKGFQQAQVWNKQKQNFANAQKKLAILAVLQNFAAKKARTMTTIAQDFLAKNAAHNEWIDPYGLQFARTPWGGPGNMDRVQHILHHNADDPFRKIKGKFVPHGVFNDPGDPATHNIGGLTPMSLRSLIKSTKT